MTSDLLTMMAGVLPEKKLIEMLEDGIREYHASPEDADRLTKLSVHCHMIMTKTVMLGENKSPMELIKDLDDMDSLLKLMNPGKQ